jgi:hypothetical protein
MIERALYQVAFAAQWGKQMRFISGPRQAGKTTLARQKLRAEACEALYYLWDRRAVRNRYKTNELFFTEDALPRQRHPWICFDEIHKAPKWKNILKAAFDETEGRFRWIITGSAKLNLLKRAGDSLAGRYFNFQLLPLMVREVAADAPLADEPPGSAEDFVERQLQRNPAPAGIMDGLLEYGGFPEPWLRQSRVFYRRWAADYIETVIREDIGSLTRIVDREHVYDLYQLLPEMAGSPISESSLASHLEVSPVTAKNYLRRLEDFFLGFSVPPYSRNIKRALLKARKFYLFDWARMPDQARRFETFVACQWRAKLQLWNDIAGEAFSLFYVRNKQKQETDFLICRESKPWLLVEAKLADGPIAPHHATTAQALGGIPVVQVCRQSGVAAMQNRNQYRVSAERLLA